MIFQRGQKLIKPTGPVVSKKSKIGIFPNLAKTGQGGGLSQKGAKSSTVGALCENYEGFSKVGKNLKNRQGR